MVVENNGTRIRWIGRMNTELMKGLKRIPRKSV